VTTTLCLGRFTDNPITDHSSELAIGKYRYYLARGVNCCLEQGYGDSSLDHDPRDDLDLKNPRPQLPASTRQE
jgi:hypothetical protein